MVAKLKKTLELLVMLISILALICSIFIGIYSGVALSGGINFSIDDSITYQTMEGFGASSCWTYQRLGLKDEDTKNQAIELLHGNSGMQLNSFRYNIGGGSRESIFDNVSPYNNGWFDMDRRAESFFVADNYVDSSSFKDINNYDFTRDAAVMDLFEKSLDTGNINTVVFFANSPHYLMTESGKTTGDYEYQNNLKPEFYEAFCDYLLTIVNQIYQTKIKNISSVTKIYISPINEPQWKWGGSEASQEGCHYDAKELAAFLNVFFAKLNEFNLANGTNFLADVFESGNYKLKITDKVNAQDYLYEMSQYDYFDQIDHISVHSYGANDSKKWRRKFAKFMDKNYPNIQVTISEFCEMQAGRFDTIESGLFLAKIISRDITMLDASDWGWWLAVSQGDYNDGLVYWDTVDGVNTFSMLKRYYTMSHFSKYISQGDVRVKLKSSDTLNLKNLDYSAYKKTDGSYVVILINNNNKSQSINLNGSFSQMTTIVTNAEVNLKETTTSFDSKITLDGKSITTILLK